MALYKPNYFKHFCIQKFQYKLVVTYISGHGYKRVNRSIHSLILIKYFSPTMF